MNKFTVTISEGFTPITIEAVALSVEAGCLLVENGAGDVVASFAPGRWHWACKNESKNTGHCIVKLKRHQSEDGLLFGIDDKQLRIVEVFDKNGFDMPLSVPFKPLGNHRVVLEAVPYRPTEMLALCEGWGVTRG